MIIFLDIDGVVKSYDGYSAGNLALVKRLCEETGAEIVLTSDLRIPRPGEHWEMRKALGEAGLTKLLHSEWYTPFNGWEKGIRWTEVRDWLERNDDVVSYVILEDAFDHFDAAPEEMAHRIVWCNNRHGFVEELYDRALSVLKQPTPNPHE